MEIRMDGADVRIGTNDLGERAIVAIDKQSGLRVLIPLDEGGARAVAEALTAGLLVVAKKLPPLSAPMN